MYTNTKEIKDDPNIETWIIKSCYLAQKKKAIVNVLKGIMLSRCRVISLGIKYKLARFLSIVAGDARDAVDGS